MTQPKKQSIGNIAHIHLSFGRAIAQPVSRWLPTAAGRVQTRSSHVGFVVEKSGAGVGFLRELRFPLPI
jgi:hypothetical protein